jgi:hypothetical protein
MPTPASLLILMTHWALQFTEISCLPIPVSLLIQKILMVNTGKVCLTQMYQYEVHDL